MTFGQANFPLAMSDLCDVLSFLSPWLFYVILWAVKYQLYIYIHIMISRLYTGFRRQTQTGKDNRVYHTPTINSGCLWQLQHACGSWRQFLTKDECLPYCLQSFVALETRIIVMWKHLWNVWEHQGDLDEIWEWNGNKGMPNCAYKKLQMRSIIHQQSTIPCRILK